MAVRFSLLLLAILRLTNATSQIPNDVLESEKTVATIDSIIEAAPNIIEYVRPLFYDDGGDIFLKHHYIVDTSKKIFYKAVYDYVNFEQVAFYYSNHKIIKAIITDTSSIKWYKCEYYFRDDSIIWSKEKGISDPKVSWNSKTVISQAKRYLSDFSGICDMLDKRK